MEFPENYGLPLLSAVCLSFECLMIGFLVPGRARGQVFTKQFLKDNFDQIHYEYTQEDVSTQFGYPDMGSGYYAQKLSYPDWLYFNRAQRVHQNLVEQIAPMLIFILVSGFEFPILSASMGFAFCLARILFIGYLGKGGSGNPLRAIGALLGDVCLLTVFVLAVIVCSRHIQTT